MLASGLQVCTNCSAMPAWIKEAWELVEEQVLVEARVSLLKLAAKLDALYPQHEGQSCTGPTAVRAPPYSMTSEVDVSCCFLTHGHMHTLIYRALKYGVICRHQAMCWPVYTVC